LLFGFFDIFIGNRYLKNKQYIVMAKKELTITEFREIIREEAVKLKKRIVLENEKKALQAELKNLLGESYVEECGQSNYGKEYMEDPSMDEGNLGMLGRLAGHEGSYKADIMKTAQKLGITPTPEQMATLLQQMKADGGQGQVMKSRDGGLFYKPSVRIAPHGAGNIAGGGLGSNN